MKCYKGFDKDLKCFGGFQYEIGKTFETDKADICDCGFHACENPMDVFNYFPPSDSRYCEVELDANDQTHNDSKRVGKRIRIETEIGLCGLIKAGIKFVLDKVDFKNADSVNTGDRSTAANTGDRSTAANTGNLSTAANTGNLSTAANTGDRSTAANTGDRSTAANTGDRSTAANTGYGSTAANTGNLSTAANTGDRSTAAVSGEESIAFVSGYQSKAKGVLGCWIVLTERDDNMHILSVKAFCVDGETVKPDVFYMLENGELKEVE